MPASSGPSIFSMNWIRACFSGDADFLISTNCERVTGPSFCTPRSPYSALSVCSPAGIFLSEGNCAAPWPPENNVKLRTNTQASASERNIHFFLPLIFPPFFDKKMILKLLLPGKSAFYLNPVIQIVEF